MQGQPKDDPSELVQAYRAGGAPALAMNASAALSSSLLAAASLPRRKDHLITLSASMGPASALYPGKSSSILETTPAPSSTFPHAVFGDVTNITPVGRPCLPRFSSFSREERRTFADTVLQTSSSSPGALTRTRPSGTSSAHQSATTYVVSRVSLKEQQEEGDLSWTFPRFDPFGSNPSGAVLDSQRTRGPAPLNQSFESSPAVSVTRHLCISNILNNTDVRAIMRVLESSGDIKVSYPDFLYSKGILTVSFYDLKEAVAAFESLQSLIRSDHRYPDVDVCFASDSQISFMYNTSYVYDSDADATLIIELHGARNRLLTFDVQSFLTNWGSLRRIIEIDRSNARRVLQVEFNDTRAAANFHADLNNQVYHGVAFVVCRLPTALQTSSTSSASDEVPEALEKLATSNTSSFALLRTSPRTESIQAFQRSSGTRTAQLFAAGEHDAYMAAVSDAETSSQHHRSDTSSSTHSFNSFSFFSQGHPASHRLEWLAQEYHEPHHLIQTNPFNQSSLGLSSLASSQSSGAYHGRHAPEPIGAALRPSLSEPVFRPPLRRIPTSSSASQVELINASGRTGKYGAKDQEQNDNNVFDIRRVIDGSDKRTTFMIRNIPNKYTQDMLKECIDATHKGTYDFLYLRIDFQNKCNVGYAFINFINVESVISFVRERVGKRWNRFNSEKRCSIAYANIQGKAALIEKFRNSTVMEEDPSYRPKIFYSSGLHVGEEEPFPLPTVPRATLKSRQESRRSREASRS